MKKPIQTFVTRFLVSSTIVLAFGCLSNAMGIPYPKSTPLPSPTPVPTPTATATPTPTPKPSPSATPNPTPKPTATPKPTPAASPKPTPASTPVATPAPVTQPTATPVQAVSLVPLWNSQASDGPSWTAHLNTSIDTIGTSLLSVNPADGATFCPQYANLSTAQRKAFWIYLVSAMAKFESNFKPTMTYTESFKNADGAYVVSRGLLQLSLEDSAAYGCGFTDADSVYDPDLNLDCGVRILNFWMKKDARIAGQVNGSWRGGARYWSTLRSTGSPYGSIVKLTQKIPFCK